MEISFLRRFFIINEFPQKLINCIFRDKIENLSRSSLPIPTVNREPFYAKFPYISPHINKAINSEISQLMNRFYPQKKLHIIFSNSFSVGSFFKFKDKVPDQLRSNIVYLYSCLHCNATYVGETTRHLRTRISEHRGVSNRTGKLLRNNPNSNIYKHYLDSGHEICSESFSIVSDGLQNLRVTESVLIHLQKPSLNLNVQSVELLIL